MVVNIIRPTMGKPTGFSNITKEADPVTYYIVLTILTQEVEHEEDLSALKEDLVLMLERRK